MSAVVMIPDPERLLKDLIATAPGEEGKWFATAKTLKRFELAMQLAWKSPCDPKTPIRAARDNVVKSPAFGAEVALAALHWICQGRGCELTSLDVQMAYRLATEAGQALGQSERVALRIQTMLKPTSRQVRWVRGILNLPGSSEVREARLTSPSGRCCGGWSATASATRTGASLRDRTRPWSMRRPWCN